jgi:hypothetical protein
LTGSPPNPLLSSRERGDAAKNLKVLKVLKVLNF